MSEASWARRSFLRGARSDEPLVSGKGAIWTRSSMVREHDLDEMARDVTKIEKGRHPGCYTSEAPLHDSRIGLGVIAGTSRREGMAGVVLQRVARSLLIHWVARFRPPPGEFARGKTDIHKDI